MREPAAIAQQRDPRGRRCGCRPRASESDGGGSRCGSERLSASDGRAARPTSLRMRRDRDDRNLVPFRTVVPENPVGGGRCLLGVDLEYFLAARAR